MPRPSSKCDQMSDIAIRTCIENDRGRWTEFVNGHLECTNYHRWPWKRVFEEVFGWPAIYLMAEKDGAVLGILPLVEQKCLLRSYLSSMPHLKGGGIVAETAEAAQSLFAAAVEIVRDTNASYLELRQGNKHGLPMAERQDKVGAVMPVVADSDERLRLLHKKVRSDVRKSLTFGLKAVFGGSELLDEFYGVYRQNMHDLGSPAYARKFFSEILKRFSDESYIAVARLDEREVAAAFVIGFRDTVEVAWASSYRQCLKLKPNMFLYWKILEFAAGKGYKWLDFGRSSRNSGTYDFKMQWGAVPTELYWSYWLNQRERAPEVRSASMQMASRVWRQLPLAVTNVLGPALIKHIPGI